MTGTAMAVAFAACVLGAGLAGALALLILLRRERPRSSLSLAALLLAFAISRAFAALGGNSLWLVDAIEWKTWELIACAAVPGLALLVAQGLGKERNLEWTAKWRSAVWASALLPPAYAIASVGRLFRLPFGLELSEPKYLLLTGTGTALFAARLMISVVAIAMLEGALRASRGTTRWKAKFLILGIASYLALSVYLDSQALLYSALIVDLESIRSYATIVAVVLIAIALFRGGDFTTEIQPSPAFLYRSLTLALASVYLLAVGVIAHLSGFFGADDALATGTFFVFVSLVALSIFLLSDQFRQNARRLIARNLYSPRYDYRREWLEFTGRTATVLKSQDLCRTVVSLVTDTFGVASATIWLAGTPSEEARFGASTEIAASEVDRRPGVIFGAAQLIHRLGDRDDVVDLHDETHERFRQTHSRFFERVPARYAVPLRASQQTTGVLTLAGRVTGESFSLEDVDLLKTIALQTAHNLRSLELSERLVRATELEAFQTLSTFFTHDLKNLASTLSLTVQNLPRKIDDPEFRKDALRVLSDGVRKMNDLCARLGTMTTKLDLRPEVTDLNDVVETTVTDLNGVLRSSIDRDLGELPPVEIDVGHIHNVLVNLLLNANEAIANGGRIAVSTVHRDTWIALTVSDTGCGMAEDFVRDSLFQPFRTTKSDGLGIGLFQSKRLVEAHGGRIEVESTPGRGSRFHVLLPTRPSR
jgi:putative PEP-CTERM system histidine kinase